MYYAVLNSVKLMPTLCLSSSHLEGTKEYFGINLNDAYDGLGMYVIDNDFILYAPDFSNRLT